MRIVQYVPVNFSQMYLTTHIIDLSSTIVFELYNLYFLV